MAAYLVRALLLASRIDPQPTSTSASADDRATVVDALHPTPAPVIMSRHGQEAPFGGVRTQTANNGRDQCSHRKRWRAVAGDDSPHSLILTLCQP